MTESRYTIREAVLADLPIVAELCSQWAAENLTRNYRADTAVELGPRLGEWFLVAQVGNQVVGFAIGEIKPTKGNGFVEGVLDDEPSYLEVRDVFVAPAQRKRGIGTGLMRELLARAAKIGAGNSLVCSFNRDYCRTAGFYEKLGYEMWHICLTRKQEQGRRP